MGNYIHSTQTSPQLLGITFIENHKFYFQDKEHINTADVSDTVRDAFQKQKILGEINHLVTDSESMSKSEIVKKMRNIIVKSSIDANISRIVYDLSHIKEERDKLKTKASSLDKDADEFIQIIKDLKHERRQIKNKLEGMQKEYNKLDKYLKDIRSTITVLYKENADLKKEDIHLKELLNQMENKDEEVQTQLNILNDAITELEENGIDRMDQALDILQEKILELENNNK
jgi:cell division protein ZapA